MKIRQNIYCAFYFKDNHYRFSVILDFFFLFFPTSLIDSVSFVVNKKGPLLFNREFKGSHWYGKIVESVLVFDSADEETFFIIDEDLSRLTGT